MFPIFLKLCLKHCSPEAGQHSADLLQSVFSSAPRPQAPAAECVLLRVLSVGLALGKRDSTSFPISLGRILWGLPVVPTGLNGQELTELESLSSLLPPFLEDSPKKK